MPRTRSGTNSKTVLYIRFAAILGTLLLGGCLLRQTVSAKSNSTQSGEGVESVIRRSGFVRVIYHGEQLLSTSLGETAGELFTRLGLEVAADDVVSHTLDSVTTAGMTLRVDRILRTRESYTTPLPHDVQYCTDPTLPAGSETILIPGQDGELLCHAEVTYTNGHETSRIVEKQHITLAPVTEVIAIGTGEPAPEAPEPEAELVISDGYITLPTGEVLTYTHTAQIRATAYTHTDAGCDFITATGTTVHIGTVAVDPRYIPYGTRMFIVSNDGAYVYGISVAEDCGGAIKGDRIDLYFPTYHQCIQFGRRTCTIYFLG